MQELNNQINKSLDFFLLAAKECGFTTAKEIENNFDIITLVAGELVKDSRERVITKISSNPKCMEWLAAKYQQRVLNQ